MAVKGKDNSLVTNHDYNDGRVPRTLCNRNFDWRSTFNSGYLIPLWCDEVYPSQLKTVDFGMLIRSITPLGPTMDTSFLDVYFFFVPNRIIWDHWEEFIAGYNKTAWTQGTVYQTPMIHFKGSADVSAGDFAKNDFVHSWLDYCPGAFDPIFYAENAHLYPENKLNPIMEVSALYPRSYAKIWNTYFRDENLQDELQIYTGDNDEYADSFLSFDLLDPSKLPKAGKLKNRFTTCWPQPQKGPDVLIPMTGLPVLPVDNSFYAHYFTATGSQSSSAPIPGQVFAEASINGVTAESNLVATNVSNTIRQLRVAVQTEKFLARDAKGTKYNESLITHFGQHSSMARLDMPEYLGSRSIPLNINQVTNTAGTSSDPLGNVGGQSVTRDNSRYFKYAVPEHGIIWAVGVVRTSISYSSGVRKMYQRKGRFDYIWPEFRHIGDVPLYTRELQMNTYLTAYPDLVFGYTPYGQELREGYNFNNGLFRENANGSLSYLTYQETADYSTASLPVLDKDWIEQPTELISKTLVDQNGPQFYGLFHLVDHSVVPLDPDSDMGYMDHF